MLLMLRIRSGGKRGKSVFFDKKEKNGRIKYTEWYGRDGMYPIKGARREKREASNETS